MMSEFSVNYAFKAAPPAKAQSALIGQLARCDWSTSLYFLDKYLDSALS